MNLYKGVISTTIEVRNEDDMDRAIVDLSVLSQLNKAEISLLLPSAPFITIFMNNLDRYFLRNNIAKSCGDIKLNVIIGTPPGEEDDDLEMDAQ